MDLAALLTTTLGISIVGIVLLVAVKRMEMKTGKVFLGQARPRIGALFHTALMWVERALPTLARRSLERAIARTNSLLHQGVAHAVIVLERSLERGLGLLRRITSYHPQRSGREVSVFLKEVSEHKRKLLTRAE